MLRAQLVFIELDLNHLRCLEMPCKKHRRRIKISENISENLKIDLMTIRNEENQKEVEVRKKRTPKTAEHMSGNDSFSFTKDLRIRHQCPIRDPHNATHCTHITLPPLPSNVPTSLCPPLPHNVLRRWASTCSLLIKRFRNFLRYNCGYGFCGNGRVSTRF